MTFSLSVSRWMAMQLRRSFVYLNDFSTMHCAMNHTNVEVQAPKKKHTWPWLTCKKCICWAKNLQIMQADLIQWRLDCKKCTPVKTTILLDQVKDGPRARHVQNYFQLKNLRALFRCLWMYVRWLSWHDLRLGSSYRESNRATMHSHFNINQ